jgi:amino acid transporter
MLVNGAYLAGLGFEGARQSGQIAADLMQARIGSAGASAISLLVMISALGAINGLIYTGSRIYSSMGADYRFFSSLARWSRKRRTPLYSLGWQCLVTLGLILLVGTGMGRAGINAALGAIGMSGVSWQGHGGFDTLLRCTAPVFWLFFLGTGLSLFVLRWRDPSRERPFSVPLYPVLPLVFCAMCGYMLYSSVDYAGKLVFIGLVPVVLGVVVYFSGGHATSVVPTFSQQQIKQETTT